MEEGAGVMVEALPGEVGVGRRVPLADREEASDETMDEVDPAAARAHSLSAAICMGYHSAQYVLFYRISCVSRPSSLHVDPPLCKSTRAELDSPFGPASGEL